MHSARYVDSHCHLDLYPRPMDVLRSAEDAGVVTVLVTETPSAFQRLRLMFGTRSRLRFAVGCHPLQAQRITPNERSLLGRMVGKADFIGEVGLDGSAHGKSTLSAQRRIFDHVLGLPAAREKLMTVHSRGAEQETIERLRDAGAAAVLHWYSGALKHIPVALDAGLYFSINAAMTRSQKGQRIIRELPRERILTETDGPFVKAGGRPSEPAGIPDLIVELAALWREDVETARALVWENMARASAGIGSAGFEG